MSIGFNPSLNFFLAPKYLILRAALISCPFLTLLFNYLSFSHLLLLSIPVSPLRPFLSLQIGIHFLLSFPFHAILTVAFFFLFNSRNLECFFPASSFLPSSLYHCSSCVCLSPVLVKDWYKMNTWFITLILCLPSLKKQIAFC